MKFVNDLNDMSRILDCVSKYPRSCHDIANILSIDYQRVRRIIRQMRIADMVVLVGRVRCVDSRRSGHVFFAKKTISIVVNNKEMIEPERFTPVI